MYRVVLVDDEPWTLIGIMNTVDWEAEGFEIVAKETNPVQAFNSICEQRPDIVFTDIKMPGMTGLELIRKIRDENIHSEIIIISGFADFNYAQEAIRQGAFDYCLKPIEEEKLMQILQKLKVHLDQKSGRPESRHDSVGYSGTNNNLKQLLQHINHYYNQNLKLKEIAEKLYMNPSYCSQLLRKELNTTFSDYLTDIRIKKAKVLLQDMSLTIQEISQKVGIKDYYYFNKVFKKHCGMTPSQYRKSDTG